jgi:putative redox protein
MDVVTVKWNGNRRFVGWDSPGHGVVMDIPRESKGEGTGARPIELFLYALGGCTGIDVASILEKQRQDVTGIEVVLTGTQREEQPRIYESIGIEYIITGRGVGEAQVARAVQLSEDKYCSVRGMLGPQVELTSSYKIVEVGGTDEQ